MATHPPTTPILHLSPAFCPIPSQGWQGKGERFGGRSKGRRERLHGPTASQRRVPAADRRPGRPYGRSRAGGCGELLTLPQPHQCR